MNTTQNTQRIIATALIAVSAALACTSCAQRQQLDADPPFTRAQVAEFRAGLRELADERARMYRELADARAASIEQLRAAHKELADQRSTMNRELAHQRAAGYRDQGERRAGLGPVDALSPDYRDQAERRLSIEGFR